MMAGEQEEQIKRYSEALSRRRQPMGFFDAFTSTKRPPRSIPILPEEELRSRLISINRDSAPFQIVDGKDKNVDFIAEWKLRNPKWARVFSDAGVQEAVRIYLRLVPEKQEVRASDRSYKVSWKSTVEARIEKEFGQGSEATIEATLLEISSKKGQEFSWKGSSQPAYVETLESGDQRFYQFTPQELKQQIQELVTACGWTYKGVTFGKL
jgi:hypothetical protein